MHSEGRNDIKRLLIIWKFNLSNQIKQDFFQAVTVSIILYRSTTWTLIKHREKKLNWELHKNAAFCLEQILEAAPNKTVGVQAPASHLTNHSNKTNKTCGQPVNYICSEGTLKAT